MTSEQQTSAAKTQAFSTPISRATEVTNTDSVVVSATAAGQPPLITLEAVRSNFLTLRQMMNDYVVEERTKGIRVQLSFDELTIIGTTIPMPENPFSLVATSLTPPVAPTIINQITLNQAS
jgi:hypothetical protein